ncbi:alpha/beta hydrolase [Inhella sp.]|uniref:alpha/beta hydrolase n=1 Tax=Inhella sp. TaxID=1921806 RepID=UPI0035B3448F
MLNRRLWLAGTALPAAAGAAPPFALAHTETQVLASARLGRRYPVHLSWPQERPAKPLPVVLVLDGESAFPWLHSVCGFMRRHAKGTGLGDFLLVGLGYAEGDSGMQSRRRDYTPWPNPQAPAGSQADDFGGGPAYAEHLQAELLPWLAQRGGDPARRVLMGHSFGALLGAWLAVHRPEDFPDLVLSSPSLWFARHRLLQEAQALKGGQAAGRMFLGAGSFEARKAGDARFNEEVDMVADLQRFSQSLRRAGGPRLQLRSQVQAGHDHATAMLGTYTEALRWLLPRKA